MFQVVGRARRYGWLSPVWLLLLLAALAPALHAQTSGGTRVEGTVLDPDNKAVVNAPVLVRNETTGAVVTTTTDGAGRFSASDLAPGSYAVEVFVPGFEAIRRTGIQVTAGAATTVSIQLSVANIRTAHAISTAPRLATRFSAPHPVSAG